MNSVFLLIAAIIALGALCNIFPLMRHVYNRFRHRKVVMCPDTQSLADVELNAGWAAFTALFRKPVPRVKSCSLWPGKKRCAQACVKDNWPTE